MNLQKVTENGKEPKLVGNALWSTNRHTNFSKTITILLYFEGGEHNKIKHYQKSKIKKICFKLLINKSSSIKKSQIESGKIYFL